MKVIKISLRFLLLLTSIAILSKLWIKNTSSFRVDKINPKNFFTNHFDVKLLDDENLDPIFNQNYKFLAKGRQSFVFVSADDKYVIKFFRFHRYRLPLFCSFIKFIPLGNRYSQNLQNEIDDCYLKTMNSYKLVYERLKDQTATIYVHLNKTKNLNKKLKITDKFKNSYVLDLDSMGFVVQKKAQSFEKALLDAKSDETRLNSLITAFFDNLDYMYSQNIINKDRHVLQNLGVIDNSKVVEIDIGRLCKKNNFNKEKVKKEALHYTTYLKKWIAKNVPDALFIVEDQLNKLLQTKDAIDEKKIH
ncbi:MAG: hypothetical protein KR126chlam6_00528 [Candidatus Anoxychlamydiales bacterium]|nr:hypothetical protein [Candidatus Anoxychlamydiales bacterium]